MKNGLQINPILFKIVVLVTCFMLAMLHNKSKAATANFEQTQNNICKH